MKGYPDSYRGLDVRVSFGKGTFARVPWIAFWGTGKETEGIYPVLLYYKANAILVLARGMSRHGLDRGRARLGAALTRRSRNTSSRSTSAVVPSATANRSCSRRIGYRTRSAKTRLQAMWTR